MATLVAAFLLGMFGLIYLTGSVSGTETERDVALDQLDEVAQDVQDVAGPQAALCAAGGDAAAVLDAAGLCARAREALAGPVVSTRTESLSAAEIEAIVSRVLALSPQPAGIDEVVTAVLARLVADPTLRGLDETGVRAIVLAVLAEQEPARDGDDGDDGADGTSFGGLTFGRVDGQCTAVVTFIDPDGSTRTETTPVGDGACDPATPDPTTQPPPGPDPTPAPVVPEQPDAVQPEQPDQVAPPQDTVTTSEPPPEQDGGGVLGGIFG